MAAIKFVSSLLLLACLVVAKDPMEAGNLFEGDMELNPEQRMAIELEIAGVPTYAATTYPNWPKEIPYQIDSSISGQSRAVSAIDQAIADYHKYTCLRFRRRRSNENAYLNFRSGSGCSSPVGYWRRKNDIKLAPGCWYKGIVIHEIMHSIGFFHEQSRPDRDNYVTILLHNVPSKNRHNFNKYSTGRINSLKSPYDYGSIMHYSATAFGGGRTTIQVKQAGARIGQRNGFSAQDIYQIKRKYRC